MDDPVAALRSAGYAVDEAIPATDELPTVYVVSRPDDVPADFLLTYGTEQSLAETFSTL